MLNIGRTPSQFFAALALSGFASIVMANPPIDMVRFENSFGPIFDPVVSAACGFDVIVTFEEKGKFTLFADNSGRVHANLRSVFSNPVTGSTVIETAVINQIFPADEVIDDEVAGTRTIIFVNTYNGMSYKWLQPGTGVLLLDAGTVTFIGTLVLDLDTGAFISFSEEITNLHGPHPSLFISNPDFIALGCGALY